MAPLKIHHLCGGSLKCFNNGIDKLQYQIWVSPTSGVQKTYNINNYFKVVTRCFNYLTRLQQGRKRCKSMVFLTLKQPCMKQGCYNQKLQVPLTLCVCVCVCVCARACMRARACITCHNHPLAIISGITTYVYKVAKHGGLSGSVA